MEYRLLEPAAAELEEAAKFYEDYTSSLGTSFLDEFERTMIGTNFDPSVVNSALTARLIPASGKRASGERHPW